jgi:hypothetical protein
LGKEITFLPRKQILFPKKLISQGYFFNNGNKNNHPELEKAMKYFLNICSGRKPDRPSNSVPGFPIDWRKTLPLPEIL